MSPEQRDKEGLRGRARERGDRKESHTDRSGAGGGVGWMEEESRGETPSH